MTAIEAVPFANGIGAELAGLDLSEPLDDARFEVWRTAFERHGVLVLRDQDISDEQQVAVSARFGPLEAFPDPKDQAAGLPTVPRVSNVDRDTDRIKPVDDVVRRSFTLGTSDWRVDSWFRRVRETRADGPGHHGKAAPPARMTAGRSSRGRRLAFPVARP